MELRSLAPEIFRLIGRYLDVLHFERLYATFDASFQKTLSFPGVIDLIVIERDSATLSWATEYFLRSIRNIRRLEVLCRPVSPLRFMTLLQGLNPLEIQFLEPQANSSVTDILMKHYYGTASAEESRLATMWYPFPIPDFVTLTPRLRCLELGDPTCNTTEFETHASLDSMTDEQTTIYQFPSSLTSLTLSEPHLPIKELLLHLPTTLRTLCLFSDKDQLLDLAKFLPRLTQLEHFTIRITNGRLYWGDRNLSLPRTLVSFSCFLNKSDHYFLERLELGKLRDTALETFYCRYESPHFRQFTPPRRFDFASLLPPAVTDLTLASAGSRSHWQVTSLPLSLTTLSLTLSQSSKSSLGLVWSLPRLSSLSIGYHNGIELFTTTGGAFERPRRSESGLGIDTSQIPRSVTDLRFLHGPFVASKSAIATLPPNLRFLSLPSFDFTLLSMLRYRSPQCLISITDKIEIWGPINGQALRDSSFGLPWTSTVDMASWSAVILQKSSLQGLYFETSFTLDPDSVPHYAPLVENIVVDINASSISKLFGRHKQSLASPLIKGLPNLKTLDLTLDFKGSLHFGELPPQLTHFKLLAPKFDLSMHHGDQFCSNLVHISTDSEFWNRRCDGTLPKTLTHLDAPNWSILYSTLSQWSPADMEKLCINVIGIMDWQIPQMIEGKLLSAKTRSNMLLTISYGISGLVFASNDLEYVDWPTICARTEPWMDELMRRPLPPSDLHQSPCDPQSSSDLHQSPYDLPQPARTFKSVIKSYTCNDPKTSSSLYFPKNARTIRMCPDFAWKLGPSELPTESSATALQSLEKLECLTLSEAAWTGPLFQSFPSKLRDLRLIGVKQPISAVGDHLPPTLEVLVLIDPSLHHPYNLPFPLSALPKTLQHLCLVQIRLCKTDYAPEHRLSPLDLPNLESVFIGHPSISTAYVLGSRLPMRSIDDFLILLYRKNEPYHFVKVPEMEGFDVGQVTALVKASPKPARFTWEVEIKEATHAYLAKLDRIVKI